jgi:hypothetical protein
MPLDLPGPVLTECTTIRIYILNRTRSDLDLFGTNLEGANDDFAAVVLVDLQFVQAAVNDVKKDIDCWPERIVGAI